MTCWMIVLLIFAIFFLIGCIPVGADVSYLGGALTVKAKIGLLRLTLLPKKPKKPKKQKKQKKPKKSKEKPKPEPEKPKEKKKPLLLSGGISGVMELLQFACDTLGDLRRKLRMERLELHVYFGAGDDAAKTAIRYGRAWALIGAILPMLERIFVIKERDIGAELDYNKEEKMTLDARLCITITIGRALALALRAGIRFLKIYKEMNKGGAEK